MKPFSLLAVLLSVATGVSVVDGQAHRRPPVIGPMALTTDADTFFDDGALHEIRLAINSRDWQSLKDHFDDNTYYPCDFRWRDQVVRNVGIRSRGTASRSGVKPGLRVDFDRYTTDQEFLGLKSFVLRNNTQDPSNMNERLSMGLFRRMGLPASREAHARLFVNNDYVGLYTIVEAVDRTFLGRVFDEDQGYLYEFDRNVDDPPYYFEYRGSDSDLYVPLPFKPETHESDPRPEFIEQLIWTINETSDAVFRTAVAGYVDLEKFVRHVAVEMFVGDNDGFLGDWGMNNFYLYRFENEELFTFIAWDKSEAFKGGVEYGIFHNITGVPDAERNRLMTRVLSYPDLYDLYLDTLLECVRSAGDPENGSIGGPGWLEREIQRVYEQIRNAALADPAKTFTNDDFERAVDDLRVFARQRGDFVAREVAQARAPR